MGSNPGELMDQMKEEGLAFTKKVLSRQNNPEAANQQLVDSDADADEEVCVNDILILIGHLPSYAMTVLFNTTTLFWKFIDFTILSSLLNQSDIAYICSPKQINWWVQDKIIRQELKWSIVVVAFTT